MTMLPKRSEFQLFGLDRRMSLSTTVGCRSLSTCVERGGPLGSSANVSPICVPVGHISVSVVQHPRNILETYNQQRQAR